MAKFVRKREGSPGGAGSAVRVEPCAWAISTPALWEFLTLDKWEGGEQRRGGTVLVCVDQGIFKAWINDRDGSCAAWCSAATLEGLWEAVEAGLRDGSHEWRPTEPRSQKPRRN